MARAWKECFGWFSVACLECMVDVVTLVLYGGIESFSQDGMVVFGKRVFLIYVGVIVLCVFLG